MEIFVLTTRHWASISIAALLALPYTIWLEAESNLPPILAIVDTAILVFCVVHFYRSYLGITGISKYAVVASLGIVGVALHNVYATVRYMFG